MVTADLIRWLGGTLQLLGIVFLVFGVDEGRQAAGIWNIQDWLLGTGAKMRGRLRRLFGPRGQVAKSGVATLTGGVATFGTGTPSVEPDWNTLTPEQKFDWLRDQVKAIKVRLEEFDTALRKEAENRHRGDAEEREGREKAIGKVYSRMNSVLLADLRWALTGAVCLFVGLFFSTVPGSIANFMNRVLAAIGAA